MSKKPIHTFSGFQRVISAFVLAAFLITHADSAHAQSPSRAPKTSVPESLGKTDYSVTIPGSSKKIFYIQDAHDSLEAQQNIARMVRHLVEHADIQTVFEEGYEGPVPTDRIFGVIENKNIQKKICDFLLGKLRIGGAEYAHIQRTKDFKLIGADNLQQYKENIQAFREASKRNASIAADLTVSLAEIETLANRDFPKPLKEHLKLRAKLDANQIPLLDYLKRSVLLIPENYQQIPLITLLLKADASKDSALLRQAGQISAKVLFEEISIMEKAIANKFLTDDRHLQLFRYLEDLSLLKRLNDLAVSSAEYAASRKSLSELKTQDLADFIARESKKSIVLSKGWEENLKTASRFYEIAHQRDGSIRKNLSAFLQNQEKNAVLVYGGFHKAGIQEILNELNVSYEILTPKISGPDPLREQYYKQLMMNGHHAFERPFLPSTATRQPVIILEETLAKLELDALENILRENPSLAAEHLDRELTRSETRDSKIPAISDLNAVKVQSLQEVVSHTLQDTPSDRIYEIEYLPSVQEVNSFIDEMGSYRFFREPAFYALKSDDKPRLFVVLGGYFEKEVSAPPALEKILIQNPEQVLFEIHAHTLSRRSMNLEYVFPSPIDFEAARTTRFNRYLYWPEYGLVQFGFQSKEASPRADRIVRHSENSRRGIPSSAFSTSFSSSSSYLYFEDGDALNPIGETAEIFLSAHAPEISVLAQDDQNNFALWDSKVTLESLLQNFRSETRMSINEYRIYDAQENEIGHFRKRIPEDFFRNLKSATVRGFRVSDAVRMGGRAWFYVSKKYSTTANLLGIQAEAKVENGLVTELRFLKQSGPVIHKFSRIYTRKKDGPRELTDVFPFELTPAKLKSLHGVTVTQYQLDKTGGLTIGGKHWARFPDFPNAFVEIDIDYGYVTQIRILNDKGAVAHTHSMIAVWGKDGKIAAVFADKITASQLSKLNDVTVKGISLTESAGSLILGHRHWTALHKHKGAPVEVYIENGLVVKIHVMNSEGKLEKTYLMTRVYKDGKMIDTLHRQITPKKFKTYDHVTLKGLRLNRNGGLALANRHWFALYRFGQFPVEADVVNGMITTVRILDQHRKQVLETVNLYEVHDESGNLIDVYLGRLSPKKRKTLKLPVSPAAEKPQAEKPSSKVAKAGKVYEGVPSTHTTQNELKNIQHGVLKNLTLDNSSGGLHIAGRRWIAFTQYPGYAAEADVEKGLIVRVRVLDADGKVLNEKTLPAIYKNGELIDVLRWGGQDKLSALDNVTIKNLDLTNEGAFFFGGRYWAIFTAHPLAPIEVDVERGQVIRIRILSPDRKVIETHDAKRIFDMSGKQLAVFYGTVLPAQLKKMGKIRVEGLRFNGAGALLFGAQRIYGDANFPGAKANIIYDAFAEKVHAVDIVQDSAGNPLPYRYRGQDLTARRPRMEYYSQRGHVFELTFKRALEILGEPFEFQRYFHEDPWGDDETATLHVPDFTNTREEILASQTLYYRDTKFNLLFSSLEEYLPIIKDRLKEEWSTDVDKQQPGGDIKKVVFEFVYLGLIKEANIDQKIEKFKKLFSETNPDMLDIRVTNFWENFAPKLEAASQTQLLEFLRHLKDFHYMQSRRVILQRYYETLLRGDIPEIVRDAPAHDLFTKLPSSDVASGKHRSELRAWKKMALSLAAGGALGPLVTGKHFFMFWGSAQTFWVSAGIAAFFMAAFFLRILGNPDKSEEVEFPSEAPARVAEYAPQAQALKAGENWEDGFTFRIPGGDNWPEKAILLFASGLQQKEISADRILAVHLNDRIIFRKKPGEPFSRDNFRINVRAGILAAPEPPMDPITQKMILHFYVLYAPAGRSETRDSREENSDPEKTLQEELIINFSKLDNSLDGNRIAIDSLPKHEQRILREQIYGLIDNAKRMVRDHEFAAAERSVRSIKTILPAAAYFEPAHKILGVILYRLKIYSARSSWNAFFREVNAVLDQTPQDRAYDYAFSYEFKNTQEIEEELPGDDFKAVRDIYTSRGFMVGSQYSEASEKTKKQVYKTVVFLDPSNTDLKFSPIVELIKRTFNVLEGVYEAKDTDAAIGALEKMLGAKKTSKSPVWSLGNFDLWQDLTDEYLVIDAQKRSETRQNLTRPFAWKIKNAAGKTDGIVVSALREKPDVSKPSMAWNDFRRMVFEFPKIYEMAAREKRSLVLIVPENLDGLTPLDDLSPWIEGARTTLAWASAYARFENLGTLNLRILKVPADSVNKKDEIKNAAVALLAKTFADAPRKTAEERLASRIFSLGDLSNIPASKVTLAPLAAPAEEKRKPVQIVPPALKTGQKRALISGGAGFLGSHITKRLLDKGYQVVVIDNLLSGDAKNLEPFLNHPSGLVYYHGDISQPFEVKGPVHDVLHFASLATPGDYYDLPKETLLSGLEGTETMLDLARKKRARFITSSTSEVYGQPLVHPQPETYAGNVNPIGKRSQYDQSKRGGETLVKLYYEKYGIDVRISRIFNTYGPGMRFGERHDTRLIPNFIKAVLEDRPMEMFGGGSQTRSFAFVDDTISGLLALLETDELAAGSPVQDRVFNIGNPREFTVQELAEKLVALAQKHLGKKAAFVSVPNPDKDDPLKRQPDISKAKAVLGFSPDITLDEGLEQTFLDFYSQFQARSESLLKMNLMSSNTVPEEPNDAQPPVLTIEKIVQNIKGEIERVLIYEENQDEKNRLEEIRAEIDSLFSSGYSGEVLMDYFSKKDRPSKEQKILRKTIAAELGASAENIFFFPPDDRITWSFFNPMFLWDSQTNLFAGSYNTLIDHEGKSVNFIALRNDQNIVYSAKTLAHEIFHLQQSPKALLLYRQHPLYKKLIEGMQKENEINFLVKLLKKRSAITALLKTEINSRLAPERKLLLANLGGLDLREMISGGYYHSNRTYEPYSELVEFLSNKFKAHRALEQLFWQGDAEPLIALIGAERFEALKRFYEHWDRFKGRKDVGGDFDRIANYFIYEIVLDPREKFGDAEEERFVTYLDLLKKSEFVKFKLLWIDRKRPTARKVLYKDISRLGIQFIKSKEHTPDAAVIENVNQLILFEFSHYGSDGYRSSRLTLSGKLKKIVQRSQSRAIAAPDFQGFEAKAREFFNRPNYDVPVFFNHLTRDYSIVSAADRKRAEQIILEIGYVFAENSEMGPLYHKPTPDKRSEIRSDGNLPIFEDIYHVPLEDFLRAHFGERRDLRVLDLGSEPGEGFIRNFTVAGQPFIKQSSAVSYYYPRAAIYEINSSGKDSFSGLPKEWDLLSKGGLEKLFQDPQYSHQYDLVTVNAPQGLVSEYLNEARMLLRENGLLLLRYHRQNSRLGAVLEQNAAEWGWDIQEFPQGLLNYPASRDVAEYEHLYVLRRRSEMRALKPAVLDLKQFFPQSLWDQPLEQILFVTDNTGTMVPSYGMPLTGGVLTHTAHLLSQDDFYLTVNSGDPIKDLTAKTYAPLFRQVDSARYAQIHIVADGGSAKQSPAEDYLQNGTLAYNVRLDAWPTARRYAYTEALAELFYEQLKLREGPVNDLLAGISNEQIDRLKAEKLAELRQIGEKQWGSALSASITKETEKYKFHLISPELETTLSDIFIYDVGPKVSFDAPALRKKLPLSFTASIFKGMAAKFPDDAYKVSGPGYVDIARTSKIQGVEQAHADHVYPKLDPKKIVAAFVVGDSSNDIPTFQLKLPPQFTSAVIPIFLDHQPVYADDLPENAFVASPNMAGTEEILKFLDENRGKKLQDIPPLTLQSWQRSEFRLRSERITLEQLSAGEQKKLLEEMIRVNRASGEDFEEQNIQTREDIGTRGLAKGIVLAVRTDKQLVAYAWADEIDTKNRTANFYMRAVRKNAQGRGIGTKLFKDMLDWLRELGVETVTTEKKDGGPLSQELERSGDIRVLEQRPGLGAWTYYRFSIKKRSELRGLFYEDYPVTEVMKQEYLKLIPESGSWSNIIWHTANFGDMYSGAPRLPEGNHVYVFRNDGILMMRVLRGGEETIQTFSMRLIYTPELDQISIEAGLAKLPESASSRYTAFAQSAFAYWLNEHLLPLAQKMNVGSLRVMQAVIPASDLTALQFRSTSPYVWVRQLRSETRLPPGLQREPQVRAVLEKIASDLKSADNHMAILLVEGVPGVGKSSRANDLKAVLELQERPAIVLHSERYLKQGRYNKPVLGFIGLGLRFLTGAPADKLKRYAASVFVDQAVVDSWINQITAIQAGPNGSGFLKLGPTPQDEFFIGPDTVVIIEGTLSSFLFASLPNAKKLFLDMSSKQIRKQFIQRAVRETGHGWFYGYLKAWFMTHSVVVSFFRSLAKDFDFNLNLSDPANPQLLTKANSGGEASAVTPQTPSPKPATQTPSERSELRMTSSASIKKKAPILLRSDDLTALTSEEHDELFKVAYTSQKELRFIVYGGRPKAENSRIEAFLKLSNVEVPRAGSLNQALGQFGIKDSAFVVLAKKGPSGEKIKGRWVLLGKEGKIAFARLVALSGQRFEVGVVDAPESLLASLVTRQLANLVTAYAA